MNASFVPPGSLHAGGNISPSSYQMQTHASAGGASTLQKLARVFREKAAEDAGRMFKGAKKSRERLGVSCGAQKY